MQIKKLENKVLGLYLLDGSKFANNANTCVIHKDNKECYLPILNMIQINNKEEVRLTNGRMIHEDITTYNSNISEIAPTLERNRKYKINVHVNDLLCSPINLLLNFTDYNITTNSPGEFRKMYSPIENTTLEEYKNKIIMLTIHSINNPKNIKDITSYGNYINNILEKFKNKTSEGLSELKEIYSTTLELLEENSKHVDLNKSNSIKIATMMSIDIKELLILENKTIYITNKNMLVSLKDLIEIEEHPGTVNGMIGSKDILNSLKSNSFVCYIVDNQDKISDRYINIAGVVKTLVKVKNPSLANGLYIIHTDNEGTPHSEIVCKLEDIDSNNYVYKTEEEANEGADIKSKYKDELESSRNEIESLKIERTKEQIEVKLKYEKELHEQKLNHEKELSKIKIDMDSFKSDLEKENIRGKNDSEYFKYNIEKDSLKNKYSYDKYKYDRESIVELIKTVGAVAGFAATGVLLYNKFVKD